MCAQLWNGLPLSVNLASNTNLFKNFLRTTVEAFAASPFIPLVFKGLQI